MNRRKFLQCAVASTLAASSMRLWSAPSGSPDEPRFLLVFLRGAYDALSAVVPYADPFYYEARPNIAMHPAAGKKTDTVIPLDARWGLHPSLGDSLMPFYQDKELAFIPFSGTDFVSRSHFQAQDWIEQGYDPRQTQAANSGFLSRLVTELGLKSTPPAGAISFTPNLPLIFQGESDVANVELGKKIKTHKGKESYNELVQAMYQGHPLQDLVSEGLGLGQAVSEQLQEEMEDASRMAVSPSSFVSEASRIGRLLQQNPNYRVGFVDIGGWDTHANQGAARGALSRRLHDLGDGLNELASSLGSEWDNTVVVVMSEFGRTFRENGSKGTDHGHGSTMWVMGGGVKGGRIVGKQSELTAESLHQGRDVPVLNEYGATLGGLMQSLYGLDKGALARVFPNSSPIDLGLV